jgi:hypothetical protein
MAEIIGLLAINNGTDFTANFRRMMSNPWIDVGIIVKGLIVIDG